MKNFFSTELHDLLSNLHVVLGTAVALGLVMLGALAYQGDPHPVQTVVRAATAFL